MMRGKKIKVRRVTPVSSSLNKGGKGSVEVLQDEKFIATS